MRRGTSTITPKTGIFFLFALIVTAVGCSLEKQSGFNRAMQNLTAHYNILFNANEILRLKQESYTLAFPDAYNELLSVYPDTTAQTGTPDKDLEEAVKKANKIISIKEQSHYLGDAYLVLGKARYLEANYFDAVEYFNYVIRSFGDEKGQANLKQEALVWKARGLMYLNQLPLARTTIDTAIRNINPKKSISADVFATKLQYDIITQNYTEAEEMAKQAIKYSRNQSLTLRWTFILAQLQELNLKAGDAYQNYTRIVKSNASFEMAFNANLNRIRIQDNQNGIKAGKIALLRSLLKNEDNTDFYDQIYYQIGEQQFKAGDIENALKSYQKSVRLSTKNQNQKGLSYLRIAEINFKNKADYASSKLYYDSTLRNLPVNYPGYQLIRKKADNLQVLTRLLETISREDTLQMLASLDEKTRDARIDAMVARKMRIQQQLTLAETNNAGNGAPLSNNYDSDNRQSASKGRNTGSTFYFYNNSAVSQGYNDFKRLWGNRKLEDNWRRSRRSNAVVSTGASGIAQVSDPDAPVGTAAYNATNTSAGAYRQELTKNLPLTPALLQQSNMRVYDAYFEMANFYRDVLEDKKEAIATYEALLARFPQSNDRPSIYYNLYRLYAGIDENKSTGYKNRVLKEYPESVFARVIADPDYARKLDDVNAEFNGYYNQVYQLYAEKQYARVVSSAGELLKKYPDNRYSAQLYYLKTIAAGHQEKLAPFQTDLQLIAAKYPQDKLVTPLVNQHLAYIDSNRAEIAARPVVLYNDDPNEIPFTPPVAYQKQTEYRKPYVAEAVPPQQRIERDKQIETAKAPAAKIGQEAAPQQAKIGDIRIPLPKHDIPPMSNAPDLVMQSAPKTKDSVVTKPPVAISNVPTVNYIFSKRDSSFYFFVINVATGTTNLASSRFGIGQFNRTRYANTRIFHLIKSVGDDNQLIYVGRFYSLDDVKAYARAIIPLMPDIMKVPKEKYSFFIITKENLDKLATPKTLESYIDYYQKYY